MRGVGEATGAITIVNALPTGVGAAIGIALGAGAEVELHPAGSRGRWDVQLAPEARTPLVIASLDVALNRYAPGSAGTASVSLTCEIPTGRGLKSSSAVSSALIGAVAQATDAAPPPLEVALLSAEASKAAGVSATGALDDALAGLSHGVVVTDNRSGSVLAAYDLPPDLGVALLVPRSTHRPSPEWATAFARRAESGRIAVESALRRDWVSAMRANTAIVEEVVGYDYATLHDELERRGAVASGVSGMGPAVAAIAATASLREVAATFPKSLGEVRTAPFSSPAARALGRAP